MGVPFECELCHFCNVNGRDPVIGSVKDAQTLGTMRRACLDAINAREANTTTSNFNQLRRDYADSMDRLSLHNPLPYLPRHDVGDVVGMQQACMVLTASLRTGNYASKVQVETVRKTVSGLSNAYGAAGAQVREDAHDWAAGSTAAGPGDHPSEAPSSGAHSLPQASPLRSPWFKRFMRGLKLRTGEERRQNEALTSAMVNALDELISRQWLASSDEKERERLEELMCYIMIGFCCGLRGEEVPMTALNGLLHFWHETRTASQPHIMIGLFGRFKAEDGHRWHCLPISDVTRSGIRARAWIELLLHRRVNIQGRTSGYLFCKPGKPGQKAAMSDYDADFLDWMTKLHGVSPQLFSCGTVLDSFSLRRSLRRGAILETTGRVSDTTIDAINRWRKKHRARGTTLNLCMRQTYMQVRDLVHERLKYSMAL